MEVRGGTAAGQREGGCVLGEAAVEEEVDEGGRQPLLQSLLFCVTGRGPTAAAGARPEEKPDWKACEAACGVTSPCSGAKH